MAQPPAARASFATVIVAAIRGGGDHLSQDFQVMHATFAVQLRVELFLAGDPVLVKKNSRTLGARCGIAEVFDDDSDRRCFSFA